jgi:hypothetical protein
MSAYGLASAQHPPVPFTPPPSIDQFLDAVWLEDGLAANTLAAYRRDLTAFAQWLHATHGKPLDSGDAGDIQEWFAARHAVSKATTANRRLASLRRYYLWALRHGLVERDPCLSLHAAKQPARFPKTRLTTCCMPPMKTAPWACATAPCWKPSMPPACASANSSASTCSM